MGHTHSSDFPTVNALYPTHGGGWGDAFIFKLSADGSQAVYSTYLGGSSYEYGQGIAVDASGNAYVTGGTLSSDFPTVNARYPNFGGGYWDAFIAKISDSGPVDVPVVITTYTTDLNNTYERVFKYDQNFYIKVVLRNTGTSQITVEPNKDIKFDFYSADDRSPITIQNPPYCYVTSVKIEPGETKASNFECKITKNEATWNGSGFTFTGKKFEVEVYLNDLPEPKKRYTFYIDEFGIPGWLRNVRFVEPPVSFDEIPNDQKNSADALLGYYEKVAQRAKDIGFNACGFGTYYKFGYHESHEPFLNYWFPASNSTNTYYSTPAQCLT